MEEYVLSNTVAASKMSSLGFGADLEALAKRYKAATQSVHDYTFVCNVLVDGVPTELPAVVQGPFQRPPWATGAFFRGM